jgi:hypothetical protein
MMSWQRRHALQLAMQLPEGVEDARLVIKHMTELLEGFLLVQEAPPPPVLRLVRTVPIQEVAHDV